MNEAPDELSKTLRLLVKRGNLTHLSIVSDNKGFRVAYRGVDGKDHRFVEGTDIVDALLEAVTGRKQKPDKPSPKPAPTPKARFNFDDLC